ncbi:MAG: CoB--CoM heterodisulfide reductase iron-sulfur subunit A family protein, partial [Butyricimonas faecihominis]
MITSVELENMFYNHSIRMVNGNTPKRIGIIHCVGSRDEKVCNYHCSKLCCITGVKQAIELRELLPDTEIFCFYMDMRMFGPGYEEMYRDAQEKYNIKFVRGRLSEAAENLNKQLQIKVEDTLVGKPLRMTLDMMILLVGMESSEGSRQMADTLGLNLAPNGFIKSQDPHYRNNNT